MEIYQFNNYAVGINTKIIISQFNRYSDAQLNLKQKMYNGLKW